MAKDFIDANPNQDYPGCDVITKFQNSERSIEKFIDYCRGENFDLELCKDQLDGEFDLK